MPTPKKLPETLTEGECIALTSQPKPRYPTGLRDLAMIRLMLNTGLRAAECLNLQVRHVDWMTGKIMVREGKGKRDRTLWVNEDVLILLRTWREKRSAQSDVLFTTLQGNRINDRALRAMVKRRAEKAWIPKDVHPHTLRHTFATEFYRQTKDIRLTQKMLGHADLSTTMIYTHVVDEDAEAAMKGFNIG